MRLSDAIALGRMLLQPGKFHKVEGSRDNGCALEMGLEAIGKHGAHFALAYQEWPWMEKAAPHCARCDSHGVGACNGSAIYLAYDRHVITGEMSMDEFIDWVRSVEPTEFSEREQENADLVEVCL